MRRRFFLLINIVLLPIICFGQPSIIRTESQIHLLNSHRNNSIKYTIKNTLEDTIYIWLQENKEGDAPNTFRHYFYSRASDFSLSMLCFDGNVYFYSPFIPVIGANFIKKLSPNELFHVYLFNCDMDQSVIHYESINSVKKTVPPQKLDEYDFIDDYVIIDSVNF